MVKKTEKQIQAGYYDIDPVLDGDTFRVQPTPNSFWAEYSFSEFAGWLQDTGRISYADNDTERIGADYYSYTFQEFWRHICHSHEADVLVRQYTEQCNSKAKDAWIAEVRKPQPSGEYRPEGLTPEQEAAWAEWYGYDDFRHPSETR